ncbi:MAG TPA: methyltransferase domain-containing protein [Dehalococcoidia bacterium]|nr:methyltransferase domain-containing protein [Dehalococcoidia bacterium]
MRVLHGTKVIEAPPSWRDNVTRDGRPVIVDLGAGDGRYAYESARNDPSRLYVGVDPDATALAEYAYRASRKPARGGVENARFVVAPLEQLPADLEAIAALVRINFPWGSLLRALLEPDPSALATLTKLAPGGRFEIVFSYDPQHDTGAFAGDPLPPLDEARIADFLAPAYRAAGLDTTAQRRLTQDEALAIPSSWGRRLLHARPRNVYWIAGAVSAAR